ncbi:hypothetical protein P691DRAFT_805661 [Macrolepiota fuliginosa MF-IS2]|uniref:Septin-type G domain-containing protein n=1 Tax=Macrolepiota fuliginosa MF-IS2 TaxID=1400762 RepID=A0A9P5XJZ5_9AGAR|nr:hypothetical protein P691DRAFT_805661 [Macrolepiota fuliginosa MF-IS2]
MEGSVGSANSTSTIHRHFADQPIEYTPPSASVSVGNSPPSSALPSPPDSPSSDSVSSFPSVSSSFFFSSAAASPPHSQPHSDHLRAFTEGLIIPSLTLPSALRRPTAHGQTIGDLRILVLGNRGAGKTFLTGLLLEDNEAVVEVGNWEDIDYGKVLCASTDWIEHRDAHGLEKYEPTRNIEIIELPGYDHTNDGVELINNILSIIHSPFHALSAALHPDRPPSSLIASLLSSSSTPLFTALVFLLPSAPTPLDRRLINELGSQIPLIVLPRLQPHPQDSLLEKLSSFRPSTAVALRSGLFNSHETLSLLRSEATDRYFRWREVERAVSHIHIQPPSHFAQPARSYSRWDKARWESDYLASLSHDVAKRARNATITRQRSSQQHDPTKDLGLDDKTNQLLPRDLCAPLDPLHLPSLFLFSISLLNPLRARLRKSISDFLDSLGSERNVRIALLGGFCVGLGIGLMVKS